MTIHVNGEPHEIDAPMTIAALLASLEIDPRLVAIEHNLVVVKRERYAGTTIEAGDAIEIVRFVGGGQA